MSKKKDTKSTQGQAGPELKLQFEELTTNEQKVVRALAKPKRPVMAIKELVIACGWKSLRASVANDEFTGKVRGNSRVRNTLRRLVRSKWVDNAEDRGTGTYRLSVNGANRLRRVKPAKSAKKARKSAAKGEQAIAF
jgi:hypothetical protein